MKSLYLPYTTEFDQETRTYCIVGQDSCGKEFGVGAGGTMELCERRLRDWILEVLDVQAAHGLDNFGDLHDAPPLGEHVVFDPVELLPIRLKLARVVAGLRQADMASRLGITQQAYAKLERPGANPTLRTILQTERVLGQDLLLDAQAKPKSRKVKSLRSKTA